MAEGPADLVIWPESSIDVDPSRSPVLHEALLEGGRLTDGRLLAGVNTDGPDPGSTFLNTSTAIDRDGLRTSRYTKRHLVPFGEYVPARGLIGWFPGLEQTPRDGVSGEAVQPLVVGDLPVAVAICFETLFGPLVRENLLAHGEPAPLLIASTNDVSFGRRDEPGQHRDQSRLRAIETGRWVLHASVAGGSALIDPEGGIHEVTDLFSAEYLRVSVPLVEGWTPYLRTGDVAGRLAMAATLAGALFVLWERRPRRRGSNAEGHREVDAEGDVPEKDDR
jgi:apolipoprotein N-acyltransferase